MRRPDADEAVEWAQRTWTAGALLARCRSETRQEVLRFYLGRHEQDAAGAHRKEAQVTLARLLNRRLRSVQALELDKQVVHYVRFLRSPSLEAPTQWALITFHQERRAELLGAFLDHWGIPHRDGVIQKEGHQGPTEAEALAAAQALERRFGREAIALYFATAAHFMPAWQASLWAALERLVQEGWLAGQAPGETHPPAAALGPEAADRFTTLDRLVEKAIVGAVGGLEGGLEVEAAEDLVEEVIQLNQDRDRSYFHRGFLHGLVGTSYAGSFVEQNATRRAWAFAGTILAFLRREPPRALVALLDQRPEAFRELLHTADALSAAARVASPLLRALFMENRDAQAVGTVPAEVVQRAALHELDLGETQLLELLLERAGELLRLQRAADAGLVLDLTTQAAEPLRAKLPARLQHQLDRRRAQSLQANGSFAAAQSLFQKILALPGADRAQLLADLALCGGRFRSLAELRLPGEREAASALCKRLDDALIQKALESPEPPRANAEFLGGLRALLQERFTVARPLLESAVAGMSQRMQLYQGSGLLARASVALALAILGDLHEASFHHAIELFARHGAELSQNEFPRWLLRKVLGSAVSFMAPTQASALIDWSQSLFPDTLDALLDDPQASSELLGKVPILGQALDARANSASRSPSRRFADHRTLLDLHLREDGRSEAAAATLDALEALALEDPSVGGAFARLLEDPEVLLGVWSYEEIVVSRAKLLEALGRCHDAGQLLSLQIHRLLTTASAKDLERAAGFRQRIAGLGLAAEETQDLDRRLAALVLGEAPEPVAVETPLRLLFLGGNELQERYDEEIVSELARRAPRLTVAFFHTGWTSNWGEQLDRIKQRMEDADGAVVMTFIRTELGRQIRRHLGRIDKPWFPCTGHGRDSLVRSIMGAAELTERSLRR